MDLIVYNGMQVISLFHPFRLILTKRLMQSGGSAIFGYEISKTDRILGASPFCLY